jgi:hypothetical protein
MLQIRRGGEVAVRSYFSLGVGIRTKGVGAQAHFDRVRGTFGRLP